MLREKKRKKDNYTQSIDYTNLYKNMSGTYKLYLKDLPDPI